MNLEELRAKIDETDDEILRLFIERMELCGLVAKYKKIHNLEILQAGREEELLKRIQSKTPKHMKNETLKFYMEILKLSKSYQMAILKKGVDKP